MTKDQANRIRQMVNAQGWDAVRNDPELAPVWKKVVEEQKAFESRIDCDEIHSKLKR